MGLKIRRAFLISVLALPCAFGYITQTLTTGGQTYTLRRVDNTAMPWSLNDTLAVGAPLSAQSSVFSKNSVPSTAVQSALATWNAVSTANIHFNTLKVTPAGHDPSDCNNVILVANDPADVSVVGGALAVTIAVFTPTAAPVCKSSTTSPPGTIYDSDILFAPSVHFSTDNTAKTYDFQSILTHELGHSMGANHSAVIGATMFWATAQNQINQRNLSVDDIAFVAAVYPAPGVSSGTLTGKVTADDGTPMQYALICSIDRTKGGTYGGITDGNGIYSITVPAGSYIVSAEPFNSFISPANISASTGVLDAALPSRGYLPTFLGGSASPIATAVSAGGTGTANITVTRGITSLTPPSVTVGPTGDPGDLYFSALNGPISLASGQSINFEITSGGTDATTTFLVLGRGLSIKAGSIHADPIIAIGNLPSTHFTLDIPAQTDTTLATLWIVKGDDVLAFSGGLVITPAAPVISSVLDAESARAAVTSGQWAAIYGNSLASTTRTWATADFTGGTSAGSPLPTSLDGVSVTVNSTPAGVYFVCSACNPNQINFVTPSNLAAGKATVIVTNNLVASAPFSVNVVQASPSFFNYGAGGKIYALGVHLNNSVTVGDPAALAGTEKAHPGETIAMYVNGIAPAPGGVIVAPTAFTETVAVSAGSTPLTVSQPFLVAAGEFQINVTIPASLAAGTYALTMTVPGGSTADSGLTFVLPVGP